MHGKKVGDLIDTLELSHDERAVRPRTCQRHNEMVPAPLG